MFGSFGWADTLILVFCILITMGIGLYHSYVSKSTNEDLLLGNRKLSVFPVAASVMVTYVSAITLLGFPSEIYSYGIQIMMMHIVPVIYFPMAAFVFVPLLYDMKLTSINEYLERRFSSKVVYLMGSFIAILQQITSVGIMLYAPSIAFEKFFGISLPISVIGVGVCATLYTAFGGLKAVVWTDAFQFIMMMAGMLAIVFRGIQITGGFQEAFKLASDRGRINLIQFRLNPMERHNFFNFIIGSGFYALMSPSFHQPQVQRYSALPTLKKAQAAIILSVPLKILIMSTALMGGVFLFATYADCDPLKTGGITKSDQILPYFVVNEFQDTPGMVGLFTSCLICAVLSSVSSFLSGLTSVTWKDYFSRLSYCKNLSPIKQGAISKLITLFYGLIGIMLAFVGPYFGYLYQIMVSAAGGMTGSVNGAFLLGIFFPFVDALSVTAGLGIGFVMIMSYCGAAIVLKDPTSVLPGTTLDDCSGNITLFNAHTNDQSENIGFLSLSYLLYQFTGATIVVIIGLSFSFVRLRLLGKQIEKPHRSTIHPWLRETFASYIQPQHEQNILFNVNLQTQQLEKISTEM